MHNQNQKTQYAHSTYVTVVVACVAVAMVLMSFLMAGCISDPIEECPIPEYSAELEIRVDIDVDVDVDVDTRADSLNPVESAYIYIFDAQQLFVKRYFMTGTEIAEGKTINLTNDARDSMFVVVIGNPIGNQSVTEFQVGDPRDSGRITLATFSEDFSQSPSEIFYGQKLVSFNGEFDEDYRIVQTIDISRRVGSVKITCNSPDVEYGDGSYQFVFRQTTNAIDFYGNTTDGVAKYRPAVTQTYTMEGNVKVDTDIFTTLESRKEDTLTVDLYKDGRLVDNIVLSQYMVQAEAGVTNNTTLSVVISYRETAGGNTAVSVAVQISSWGVIIDQSIEF